MPKNLIEDDQASSPKRADSGVQIFSSSDMLKINDDQAARLSDKNEMVGFLKQKANNNKTKFSL